jgi:hypothetical protein
MGLKESILVTGSHRSGTTWVGKVLALAAGTRYVQEPFNRETNPTLNGYQLGNMYAYAPDEDSRELRKHYLAYLNAKKRERLILKDPIALFSAPWLQDEFGVEVVCLVRHPAGFVSSLIKWKWEFHFGYFASQPHLMRTFPESVRAEIEHYAQVRQEPILQACLLWKVIYGWLLAQHTESRKWNVLKYEDFAEHPQKCFSKLYLNLKLDWTACIAEQVLTLSGENNPGESDDPSFKARNSRLMREVWMDRLTPQQIRIVKEETASVWLNFYSENDWELH